MRNKLNDTFFKKNEEVLHVFNDISDILKSCDHSSYEEHISRAYMLYGKNIVTAFFYNEALSDKYWDEVDKMFNMRKIEEEHLISEEEAEYLSAKKRRAFPVLVKGSHYTPYDRILNKTKPMSSIKGFPRLYTSTY